MGASLPSTQITLHLGVDAVAELRHAPVDRDASLDDQDLARSARTVPGARERLLESLALVQLRHLGVVELRGHLVGQLVGRLDRAA